MKTDLDKPCEQCPFWRKSAPGWLGPWAPDDLVKSLTHQAFPCHETIKHDDQSLADSTLQSCAGAAIFMNNKLAISKEGWTIAHQRLLKDAGVSDEVKQSVFANDAEFIAYHTRSGWKPPHRHTRVYQSVSVRQVRGQDIDAAPQEYPWLSAESSTPEGAGTMLLEGLSEPWNYAVVFEDKDGGARYEVVPQAVVKPW